MSQAFIFIDDGRWWPECHHGLADALGANCGGLELADYVVRNLGFLRVERKRNGALVTYNARIVNAAASARLRSWLVSQRISRVVLEDVDSPDSPARLINVCSSAWPSGLGQPATQPANSVRAGTMPVPTPSAIDRAQAASGAQHRKPS
jgi:hypothetical protein